MFFKRKTPDYKQYNQLLKEQNETLAIKITRLEQERAHAISEKEKALEMLNRYKTEYESLIQDTKKLIQKQKESDKVVNNLIENLQNELADLHLQKGGESPCSNHSNLTE